MKCLSVVAVLAAVVSSEGGGLRAQGESLRQVMESRRAQVERAPRELASKNMCKPAKPSQESRKCENPNLLAPACTCKERCHVWGDPHLRPFYFGCPFSTMHDPGMYTLWRLPGNEKNDEVHFEIEVIKEEGHAWTKKLFLDGELILDADKNCSGKEFPIPIQNELKLFSDDQLKKNGEDVTVEYYAACRKKTNGDHRNVKQIEVIIDVKQSAENPSTVPPGDYQGVTDSTTFFANDEGYCVDPKSEKYSCKRQSGLESFKGQQSGRKCSCESHCAVFGDPYFYDMYTDHTKLGFSAAKDIIKPKNRQRHLGDNILYSVGDRFAVEIEMDECEFIEQANIYVLKEEAVASKLENCDATETDAVFTASDYDIHSFNAPDLCSDEDVEPDSRRVITFPDLTDDLFSKDVDGYDLGRYLEVEPEVDDQLFNSDFNRNTLVPISRSLETSASSVTKCMNSKNVNPDLGTKIVELGGAKVLLKCHRSKGNRKGKFKKYFNICVEKADMKSEEFTTSPFQLMAAKAQGNSFSAKEIRKMEEAGRTFGYCATGAATNPKNKNFRNYEYRSGTEYKVPGFVKEEDDF